MRLDSLNDFPTNAEMVEKNKERILKAEQHKQDSINKAAIIILEDVMEQLMSFDKAQFNSRLQSVITVVKSTLLSKGYSVDYNYSERGDIHYTVKLKYIMNNGNSITPL